MTQAPSFSNRATLEDCHTNLFSLTDLGGIRWRRLSHKGNGVFANRTVEPHNDLILSSYSKCLQAELLCVWRRVLPPVDPYGPQQAPVNFLNGPKELWIFWYGEEPDFASLVHPDLLACNEAQSGTLSQGSWEEGLSYECRTLLFKALHNLIERCLLARDYVRLGRWFIQPYPTASSPTAPDASHLAFSFTYFLHGESTVVCSLDVRQQVAVRRVQSSHLVASQHSELGTQVLLAPWGLAGTLTGVSWKLGDPVCDQTLKEWRQFYPIPMDFQHLDVPPVIEVSISGMRVRYPSIYVLVTDLDTHSPQQQKQGLVAKPSSPMSGSLAYGEPAAPYAAAAKHCPIVGGTASRRVLASSRHDSIANADNTNESMVEVGDPLAKSPCHCPSKRKNSQVTSGSSQARTKLTFHKRQANQSQISPTVGPSGGVEPTKLTVPLAPTYVKTGMKPPMEKSPACSVGPSPYSAGPRSMPMLSPQAVHSVEQPPASVESKATPYDFVNSASNVHQSPVSNLGKDPFTPRSVQPAENKPASVEPLLDADADNEPSLNSLYDYGVTKAWLNHPVKSLRYQDMHPEGKIAIDARVGPDDGEFHEVRPSSQQEGEERGVKRKEPFREEDDSKLYTLKGLEPSYSDLDNMFEDDTPDGSDPIPPTPPGSNKPSDSVCEETKLIIAKTAMASPGGFLGPAELSKMFPTPPSHEHPLPSPMDVGSPPSPYIELDKDFVYRPFPVSYIVSSDTYSPLLDLPSSRLPPLVLAKEFVYVPEPRQMRQFNRPPSLPVRAPIPLVPRPGVSPISPSPFTPQRNSHATGMPTLHANALLVNVLLSDSLLNVFRDHNFESCSLCVCNAGPNLVGNIKGRDSALYLPDALKKNPTEDDAIVCDCGFSALVNRRLASGSGLFYEDESDICGVQHTYDPANNRKIPLQNLIQTLCKLPPKEALQLFSDCGFPLSNQTTGDNPVVIDHPGQTLIDLIRDQCNVVLNECNSLCSLSTKSPVVERILNHLEFIDGCEIVQMVMEQARIGPDPYMGRYDPYYQRPEKTQPKPLHRWPHVQTVTASCSQDVLRVMKCLQPLLQEATQKRRTPRLWEAGFTVQGPLTWRQFHRIIAKGTDDNCEALPIPLVLCGFDRDWICVGPHSFLYWERLTLEPYAAQRDVAYVVVTPDSEYLVSCVKMFFKEVSSTYENCRLGKHRPITRVLRDGILRVNRSTLAKLQSEPIDEWFNAIGDSNVATLLKAYAQACRNSLAPHLATLPLDHSLLEYNSGGPKTMAPPVTITNANDQENQQQQQAQPAEDNSMAAQNPQYPNQSTNNLQSQSQQGTEEAPPPAQEQNNNDEDDADPPTIVVYVLDPFSYGPFKNDVNLRRFGTIGLLRCLNQMIQALSENLQGNIVVQLISMESVLSIKNQSPQVHRAAAFQVYSQCRRSLIHQCNVVKSLTGLGPAAQLDAFLKTRSERYKIPHRLYCPPYVLAPVCEKGSENELGANSLMSLPKDKSQTLYVSYCLSHDQRYLLATATDDRGELRESCTISIEVPRRRKRISARRHALNRLMDFIVGVMSQGVLPWRLVIGRLGRVGHGELKGWSSLLSKHALQKISQQIGDMCGQCGLMSPLEMPGIISACLISLEPDSAIQVFADQVTPDDRASNQTAMGNLSTPEDSSTTHILVFPMSAATSLPQQFMPGGNDMNPDLEEDIGLFGNLEDEIGGDMLGNDFGDMGDMGDLFSSWPDVDGEMAPGSPSNSVGQGQMQAQHQQNEFGGYMNDPNCVSHMGGTGRPMGEMEEVGLVLQQPLALGYYVSTAGTGTMPDWFWSSCPHLHGNNPVFLKASLHLHSSSVHQNSDDNPISQSANPNGKCHPLDSKYTTDVLRFVLEGYNALSWLAVDASGKDRRSCLPVHIQLLVQLYHAFSNLI